MAAYMACQQRKSSTFLFFGTVNASEFSACFRSMVADKGVKA